MQKESLRRIRYGLGCLLILAFLAIAAVGFFVLREVPQPRYLGKTAAEWFPVIPFGAPVLGSLPEELITGDPESLPVLIAAARKRNEWWIPWIQKLPPRLVLKFMPPGIGGSDHMRRYNAAQAICLGARSQEFAREVAAHLGELPLEVQLDLEWIQDAKSRALIEARLRPFLELALRDGDFEDRLAAGFRLTRYPDLSDDTLRRLFRLAEEMLDPLAPPTKQLANYRGFLMHLGAHGPVPDKLTARLRAILPRLSRKARLELRIALTRLNPVTFPASLLLQNPADPVEAFAQFEAACGLVKSTMNEGRIAENLRPILEVCLNFQGAPAQADPVVRDKVSMLMEYASGTKPSAVPAWVASFAVGLDDPSRQVRRACAWTLYQMKANSPEVVDHVARLLEQGREPELALMILTEARVVPERVKALVNRLAAGEPVKDWIPEPAPDRDVTGPVQTATRAKSLQQFAQALLASVAQPTGRRL